MRIFLGFLIGLVLAGAIAATAFKVAWGDIGEIGDRERGDDKTTSVAVADFDRINIAGVFELDVGVGGDYALTLSGAEEDLARTTAVVEDGVLVLDTGEQRREGKKRFIKHSVTAKISMPALNGIEIAGVVDGDIRGVNAENFRADLSGVGDLDLSGNCGAFEADVSGVGDLDAEELKCRSVNVDVSGVGSASVYASESVDAEIAGLGSIEISGSPPQVTKSQSSPLGRISVK